MRTKIAALLVLLGGAFLSGCNQDQSGLIEAQSKVIKDLEARIESLEARPIGSVVQAASDVGQRETVDIDRLRREMRQEAHEIARDLLAAQKPVAAPPTETPVDGGGVAAAPGPELTAALDRYMRDNFATHWEAQRTAEETARRERQRAQMRSGTDGMIDRALGRAIERGVQFTEADKTKVKEAALAAFDQRMALEDRIREREAAGEDVTREERQREQAAIRENAEAALKVSLSPEQYDAVRPFLGGFNRGEGMAFGNFGGGGAEMPAPEAPAPRARGGNNNDQPNSNPRRGNRGGTPNSGDS